MSGRASASPERLKALDAGTEKLDAAPGLTLYVAGPMTGIEDFNRPAFGAAALRLRRAGYTVLNPGRLPAPVPDPDWADWMRQALRMMLDADGVAMLPGSESSRGAALERRVAVELGIPVRTVPAWLTLAGQSAYMERLRA